MRDLLHLVRRLTWPPVVVVLLSASCGVDETATAPGGESPGEEPGLDGAHPFRDDARALLVDDDTTRYRQTAADHYPVTLCQQVYYADGGAGLYRVVDATGVVEQPLDDPEARPASVTYFELERLEDWGGDSPVATTLRILGGPRLDGGHNMLQVRLVEGEEVGLFIKGAEPDENAGFAGLAQTWVWRRGEDGLYTNWLGSLRFDVAELRRRVREVYATFPDVDLPNRMRCRIQVPFEQCPPDSLVPDNALMLDGEEGCEGGRWLPGYEPPDVEYGPHEEDPEAPVDPSGG